MAKIAILSGRYELVHPGHIQTIRREAARFRRLYVYVVDRKSAPIPSLWSAEILRWCTMDIPVVICLSPVHFGRATKKDIGSLPKYDIFLSANPAVSAHLRSLGVPVKDISMTVGYSSTRLKICLLRDMISSWAKGKK